MFPTLQPPTNSISRATSSASFLFAESLRELPANINTFQDMLILILKGCEIGNRAPGYFERGKA